MLRHSVVSDSSESCKWDLKLEVWPFLHSLHLPKEPNNAQTITVPKNVQTPTQLHSIHMQSNAQEFSKLGYNRIWTKNFQMFELDLEKAEEPEIKLTVPIGS